MCQNGDEPGADDAVETDVACAVQNLTAADE
jgi:hypothetical protein